MDCVFSVFLLLEFICGINRMDKNNFEFIIKFVKKRSRRIYNLIQAVGLALRL